MVGVVQGQMVTPKRPSNVTGAQRYLVTGGAGFIGSHVVDALMARPKAHVTVFDRLTYAGSRASLQHHEHDPRYRFVLGDVAEPDDILPEVRTADRVLHLAAESDIGRSLSDARLFLQTNLMGTAGVLEACRITDTPLLVVSTDGVYGSGEEAGWFAEEDPLRPSNPYTASKAGADLLATAYHATYGIDVTVVRGTNAYGPRQHPEKGIPTFILAALDGRQIPVYGDGRHRREWLFVTDWAAACLAILDRGDAGRVYNIGGGTDVMNMELAEQICRLAGVPESLVASVPDRPAHDLRYGVAWERLATLDWSPRVPFADGLALTVRWYEEHRGWADEVLRRVGDQPAPG